MTMKIRVIRNLKAARSRLRDVAAAAHSNAAVARDRSAAELQGEHDSLEAALDEAADSLAAARTVHDLDRVAEHTFVYRMSVADAAKRHEVAQAASELTADQLRERTRQLRTAERLVEQVENRRARRESRAERRRVDDMTARRR
jgi:flagellar biosynthesis chaperone FliJ